MNISRRLYAKKPSVNWAFYLENEFSHPALGSRFQPLAVAIGKLDRDSSIGVYRRHKCRTILTSESPYPSWSPKRSPNNSLANSTPSLEGVEAFRVINRIRMLRGKALLTALIGGCANCVAICSRCAASCWRRLIRCCSSEAFWLVNVDEGAGFTVWHATSPSPRKFLDG